MDRLPSLPDPGRLQGLWTASGVEAGDQQPPLPAPASGRIRFGAAPPSPPQPPPRPQVPPPPPPAATRAPNGPPLPPRVPGPPTAAVSPAVAAAAAALSAPPRPAVPTLPDEVLAAQIFGGGPSGLDSRLNRLLEFAARQLQATSAFIADPEGLTVASLRSNDALAAVTAPLGGVQEKIAAFVPAPKDGGGAVVELEEQQVLQLVWAPTAAGRLAMGMVLQSPLDRASTKKLRRLVQLAVDMKGAV
jgi:hypothetical protein